MKRFFQSPFIILLIVLVAMNVIDGDFSDPVFWIVDKLLLLPAIVIGLSFHEFAHGITSHWLGDPTPKAQGRLTLNPLKHFDAFGFLALLFAGFGWGIPVEIDPRYYKHPRRDELLVSLAGVTMNFIIAVAFCFILKGIFLLDVDFGSSGVEAYILDIIVNVILINIVLMVFNLLPIPPLDGFGVITEIFNLKTKSWYRPVYENGFAILMVLMIVGLVDKIISPPIFAIYNLLLKVFFF